MNLKEWSFSDEKNEINWDCSMAVDVSKIAYNICREK